MNTKNNQNSRRFRLQSIDEHIFISFRKFYGKIIVHGLPFIFAYNLKSPKIIKLPIIEKTINKNCQPGPI